MADKSHPVIIMALEVRDSQSGGEGDSLLVMLMIFKCCARKSASEVKRENFHSTAQALDFFIRNVHDDFLPDGVVGNESRGLFFIRHRLCGVHDILEHGSLSV